jgi:PKD repeat protein
LLANDPGTEGVGYWTTVSGTAKLANSALFRSAVTNLSIGLNKFRWTVTGNGCQDTDDLIITNNLYEAVAAADQVLACSGTARLNAKQPPVGVVAYWDVYGGNGSFEDANSNLTVVNGLAKGVNTIRWIVEKNGCKNFADVEIENLQIEVSAGADQVVCGTTAQLTANNPGNEGTGVWSLRSGRGKIVNSLANLTNIENLGPNVNTLRWTITEPTGRCSSYDEVVIANNFFTTTAGYDQTVCGTTANITAAKPVGGTGKWIVVGGGASFDSNTSYTTVVRNLNPGVNTLKWEATIKGCTAEATVLVTNNAFPAIAGGDQPVCEPIATLNASPPNVTHTTWTGSWRVIQGAGTFDIATKHDATVSRLGVGENKLQWSIRVGNCETNDFVSIFNNTVTSTAGANRAVCSSSARLNADDPVNGKGRWRTIAGSGSFDNNTAFNTRVVNMYEGANTFEWEVEENGCRGISYVTITNNSFETYAGKDDFTDAPNYGLNAKEPPTTGVGTWYALAGSGNFVLPNDFQSTVLNIGTGINTYQWKVLWKGCTATDEVKIVRTSLDATAGPDQHLCVDTTQLAAIEPEVGEGRWTVASGAVSFENPELYNTKITDIQRGENILRWTVTKSGYSISEDVIIYNHSFDVYAGRDQASCNSYTTLEATEVDVSYSGTWSVVSGAGKFVNASLQNTVVQSMAEGENVFKWEVRYNHPELTTVCKASDEVTIVNYPNPVAGLLASEVEGCSPLQVNFTNTSTSGAGYKYHWNFGDGTSSSKTDYSVFVDTNHSFENNGVADTTYYVRLIAETDHGCRDTLSPRLPIRVYSVPKVDFSASPYQQVIPNVSVDVENLILTNYRSYNIDFGDGTSIQATNKFDRITHEYKNPVTGELMFGTFNITMDVTSKNLCRASKTKQVKILAAKPESAPGVKLLGCAPYTAELAANTKYADSYLWTVQQTGRTSNLENPKFSFDKPGKYLIQLTAAGPGGITQTKVDTVIVHDVPVVDFDLAPDTIMLPKQPVRFYNMSQFGVRYEWDFGDGNISSEEEPVYYYEDAGVYDIKLTVWTEKGCSSDKTRLQAVVAEAPGAIVFPNAFVPSINGAPGGRYDPNVPAKDNYVFHPKHRHVVEYRLLIFNQWGAIIYESNDVNVGWDGYLPDGKLASLGVYIWKAEGKFKNGVQFSKVGNVTLLR